MPLSRMDLADVVNPGALAKAIHAQWPDMPIPVPVERVASELDIASIAELTTAGFLGALATDASRSTGAIFVARDIHRIRRRFTIGHELGHFLSPWHKPRTGPQFLCTADDLRRSAPSKDDPAVKMEAEANFFAVNLLLPERQFKSELRKQSTIEIDHVLNLAATFDMSKEATARRYVELHDEPCGVIVSHNGIIQRVYKSRDFPWIEPRKDTPLPADSISAHANGGPGFLSAMAEVPGSAWFPSGRDEVPPKTYEQVLIQKDNFRLTLLTIEPDLSDDEENIEERWRVGFHKK